MSLCYFVVPGVRTALRFSLFVSSSFVFRTSAACCTRHRSKLGDPRSGFARGSCFVIAQFSRPAHPLLHSGKLLQSTGSIAGKVGGSPLTNRAAKNVVPRAECIIS